MSATPAFFSVMQKRRNDTDAHDRKRDRERISSEWATAQEIINGNEPFCETQPWSFRDREFVKMLVEKKILTT